MGDKKKYIHFKKKILFLKVFSLYAWVNFVISPTV